MEEKFKQLALLGAADFQHLNGSLIEHLKGTRDLLASWSAAKTLQDAGLYHAAYGTAGFNQQMISVEQRTKIANIIGPSAEEIVYQYCACDRSYFWPKLSLENNPDFRNRFNGAIYTLDAQMLKDFCELTVANELEIESQQPGFITVGGQLHQLFLSMRQLLSPAANKSVINMITQH
jgi:hypothetical protein